MTTSKELEKILKKNKVGEISLMADPQKLQIVCSGLSRDHCDLIYPYGWICQVESMLFHKIRITVFIDDNK